MESLGKWTKNGFPVRAASELKSHDYEGKLVDFTLPVDMALALEKRKKVSPWAPVSAVATFHV